jgi:hypothetical protein
LDTLANFLNKTPVNREPTEFNSSETEENLECSHGNHLEIGTLEDPKGNGLTLEEMVVRVRSGWGENGITPNGRLW